jgi:cell division transport system permease protein
MKNTIVFFLRRAAANMAGERTATLLTLTVVIISFFIFGAYATIGVNLVGFVDHFAGHAQIVFYLKDGADGAQIEALQKSLKEEPDVQEVAYLTSQQALERLKRDLADAPEFLESLQESPVPASVEVKTRSAYRERPDLTGLIEKAKAYPIVESVDAGDEFSDAFARILSGMWAAGGIIAIFLMLSAIFIVANTIRLTIIRRRDEIENMRLVGATNAFVKAPFLIEGVIVGAVGAAAAIAVLYLLYRYLFIPAVIQGPALTVFTDFNPQFLRSSMVLAGIALGAFVGIVGAQLSVGRYLKI